MYKIAGIEMLIISSGYNCLHLQECTIYMAGSNTHIPRSSNYNRTFEKENRRSCYDRRKRMIALKDDRITERNRTLAYFKDNSILRYRDFVEDIGHKYVVQEHEIKKSMEELPFD